MILTTPPYMEGVNGGVNGGVKAGVKSDVVKAAPTSPGGYLAREIDWNRSQVPNLTLNGLNP